MDTAAVFNLLKKKFGEELVLELVEATDPFIRINSTQIQAVCLYLRYNPLTQYAMLTCISGVDYPKENRIELVYHLYSLHHQHYCVLKTALDRKNPEIETIESVWKVANWFEREIYDLLGVRFIGHSNLKRILMPEDWKGHPLRKDYQEELVYHDISTIRELPLEVLKGDHGKKEGT